MPSKRDIIVIGASAGGLEALQSVVRGLPEDLAAAVFVVMHLAPRSRSVLPEILTRFGRLAARHPVDGAPIVPGVIYVASPDQHLIVEREHVHLTCGPKEQHHRPCINVLFRSAALAYGERVIGVLLSGEMDDGTAGLWEIERRGGLTVVQNPEDAPFPSMPLSALREVEVDHVVSAEKMGSLLGRLTRETEGTATTTVHGEEEPMEVEAQLTDLTCPECRGTIWEVRRGNSKDYRCRVGHTYSPKSMLASHFAAQEKALYAAIVALEEGASLALRLADRSEPSDADRLRKEASEREAHAQTIRDVLKQRLSFEVG